MRSASVAATALAAAGSIAQAATLQDVCTSSYAKAALPADDFLAGVTIDPSTITASAVTNSSVSGSVYYPDATFDYCNVTFAYTHNGLDDQVYVQYWLPTPSNFQNRYLSTGGFGYAINSVSGNLPGGIIYGAAAGGTDGGFGGFSTSFDAVYPLVNGTANLEALYMFGYEAIHELTIIGKVYTKSFFNMTDSDKLYSYYQGCSEGGRDGWSQVQRYGDEFDGAITGAPAIRFAFQQLNHLYSNMVEQTLDYYPPPCELEKIVNETIAACDLMDGLADGVIGRSDLCKLNFDLDTTIGTPYYCAASSGTSFELKRQVSTSSSTPAQNGTITAKGVAVAKQIIDGLHDSDGKRVYLSYQPGAAFQDAETSYNSTTGAYELSVSSFGAEFAQRFLNLVDADDFSDLDGVTYDTLKAWMIEGWQRYEDSLHTGWPDLSNFHAAGGKVLHFHGEADPSIPTAASIRFHESVRSVMYPNMTFNESTAAVNDWYRLYLVPGAAHCATNSDMPNGPFPQTNLAVMIDWVENGVVPTTLNATILSGDFEGTNQQLCTWPLRPYWSNNGTTLECQYDQASIDSWIYDFDGLKSPLY